MAMQIGKCVQIKAVPSYIQLARLISVLSAGHSRKSRPLSPAHKTVKVHVHGNKHMTGV